MVEKNTQAGHFPSHFLPRSEAFDLDYPSSVAPSFIMMIKLSRIAREVSLSFYQNAGVGGNDEDYNNSLQLLHQFEEALQSWWIESTALSTTPVMRAYMTLKFSDCRLSVSLDWWKQVRTLHPNWRLFSFSLLSKKASAPTVFEHLNPISIGDYGILSSCLSNRQTDAEHFSILIERVWARGDHI